MALDKIYVLPGKNHNRGSPIPQAQHLCKDQVNSFWTELGQTSSTGISKVTDIINQNVKNYISQVKHCIAVIKRSGIGTIA